MTLPEFLWNVWDLADIRSWLMWDEETAFPICIWGFAFTQSFDHLWLVKLLFQMFLKVRVNHLLHFVHQLFINSMIINLQIHRYVKTIDDTYLRKHWLLHKDNLPWRSPTYHRHDQEVTWYCFCFLHPILQNQ